MKPKSLAERKRLRSLAVLVRRVAIGEADLVVTLFTEQSGIVAAIARSARRSSKRFASLEPMHLLDVAIDERPGAELATLVEAHIARPRLGLSRDLARLEAAGKALRWIRHAVPPHTVEPEVWLAVNEALDAMDAPGDAVSPGARLSALGLRLLGAIGWGLELDRCVACGKPCDEAALACIDAGRGGLVCRACGGARTVLRADRRRRLAAAARGQPVSLGDDDVRMALELVDAAFLAHTGLGERG